MLIVLVHGDDDDDVIAGVVDDVTIRTHLVSGVYALCLFCFLLFATPYVYLYLSMTYVSKENSWYVGTFSRHNVRGVVFF